MTDSTSHDNSKLRSLPSVDRMLTELAEAVDTYGHQAVTGALRSELARYRENLIARDIADVDAADIKRSTLAMLVSDATPSLRKVFNLTGTVLHTNLGRAALPDDAVAAISAAAKNYTNLEFDLDSGERGNRERHVEALVCELTGAEAATVVNNNAAAVLLVLNTLAMNREVPVSRGELVEIGGSFRIPEVMQRANCTLVEVGATNRTHVKDYRAAISDQTGLLLKVHTSNYKIEGFTKEVSTAELASLGAETGLPVVMDLGSGSLVRLGRFGLPDEPTCHDVIRDGADIITFSGDKLLGGPQSGLIAGRKDLIDAINRNPLKRALRLDKMTLAGMAVVLKLYRDPDSLCKKLPALRHLTRPLQEIRSVGERMAPQLRARLGKQFKVSIIDARSQIGSGALPTRTIPSVAISIDSIDGDDRACRALASAFRKLPIPVIGYMHKGRLNIDLRCLEDESAFAGQLESLQI